MFQKVRKFEEKRKEYNELLEQISRSLDQSNQLQQFIVVCTERGTLEENGRNTQIGRVLFEKLERRGHFAFNRLDFLKGILSEIERQDLVEKVQDFEKRRIDEDEFERRKAQAGSIVAAARVVGGRVIGVLNMKTVCEVAAAGITLLTVRDILTRWSTHDQLVACFQECVLPAGSRLIGVGRGCVCFTIQVDNLMGLTALWNRYEDGTLKERLFDFFVTDEMKTCAGGEENVELTVTIVREEYEKAYFELVQEADGNQRRILERGVRRHSDSVLSVPPKDEEKSLVTLTQVKNQVKSLEERMEVLETQMVPFEKAHEYVNFEDKFRYIMTYVNDLQNETRSIMSEISDSGLPTSGAQSEIDLESVDESEITSTELDQWNLLSSAIKTGHVTTMERILSQGFDIDSKYSHDGETLLMIAVRNDNLVVVRYLLDKGADPNSSNWFDRNLLHLASQSGNVTIIKIFLSRGLDISSKDRFGGTPLIFAAASGKSEAVDYLLDNGADFFAKGKLRRSGLHAASQSGSVATIETMLSRGLGIDSKDRNGDTPLIIAAVCGKSEAFNYLFHKGADPWVRGNFGRNLLHAASSGGNVTIIKTVVSLHEDINSKDGDGNTALIIAALSGNCEAFHYLLENNADPSMTG